VLAVWLHAVGPIQYFLLMPPPPPAPPVLLCRACVWPQSATSARIGRARDRAPCRVPCAVPPLTLLSCSALPVPSARLVDPPRSPRPDASPARSGQAGVDVNTPAAPPSYADMAAHPLLAAGDVAVFLAFATIGAASHAANANPLSVTLTAAPFIVAWLAVAPLMGAYTRRAVGTYQGAAVTTARAWLVGVPSGLALRGVVTSHLPPPSFAVVTLLSTAVLLGVWRGSYVKLRGAEVAEGKRGGVLDGFRMITTLLRRW